MNIQLLEESGAISQNDAKRSSESVNYQDTLPDLELVSSEDNDNPASKDDEPESHFEVDMSVIGRVQKFSDFSFFPLLIKYSKLRKIVCAVRASPQRRQLWLRTVQLTHPNVNTNGTRMYLSMLILDVRTCWSSTYAMLRMLICLHLNSS